jgi:hypothetical protein
MIEQKESNEIMGLYFPLFSDILKSDLGKKSILVDQKCAFLFQHLPGNVIRIQEFYDSKQSFFDKKIKFEQLTYIGFLRIEHQCMTENKLFIFHDALYPNMSILWLAKGLIQNIIFDSHDIYVITTHALQNRLFFLVKTDSRASISIFSIENTNKVTFYHFPSTVKNFFNTVSFFDGESLAFYNHQCTFYKHRINDDSLIIDRDESLFRILTRSIEYE